MTPEGGDRLVAELGFDGGRGLEAAIGSGQDETGSAVAREAGQTRAPGSMTAEAASQERHHQPSPLQARSAVRNRSIVLESFQAAGAARLGGKPGPACLQHGEVELREPIPDGLRTNIDSLSELQVKGDRTVRTLAADMDLGFRRIAYLGYGEKPGLTRY